MRSGRCLERACCAATAAWLMLCSPTVAYAAPEALPYQEADQTAETQRAKTAPLSQDKQSAATDSSSQLPPLPTSFPLLPDIVVQAPQEVSPVLDCLLQSQAIRDRRGQLHACMPRTPSICNTFCNFCTVLVSMPARPPYTDIQGT